MNLSLPHSQPHSQPHSPLCLFAGISPAVWAGSAEERSFIMVCVLAKNVMTDHLPQGFLSGQNIDLLDCSAFPVSYTNTDV